MIEPDLYRVNLFKKKLYLSAKGVEMTFLDQCKQIIERATLGPELDCGDNSCLFATNKGGMRTNGGCRCFEHHGFHRSQIKSAQMMLPELIAYRKAMPSLFPDFLTQYQNLKIMHVGVQVATHSKAIYAVRVN